MYFPGYLVFAAAGVCFCIFDLLRKRAGSQVFMLMALLSSVLSSFFIEININRMNMAFLPIAWFTAYGLYQILCCAVKWRIYLAKAVGTCSILLILMSTAYAGVIYMTSTMKELSASFFEGLGDALQYAQSLDYSQIYVTGSVKQPYIYALFYNEISPQEFYETVEYEDEGAAFRQVLSFSGYVFGSYDTETYDPSDMVFILEKEECGSEAILAEFGNYAVCVME